MSTQLTTLTRDYISEPAITRMNRMLTYVNEANQTYSVRRLPSEGLYWGPESPGRDNPSLYLHKDGKPITVWMLGELSSFTTKVITQRGYRINASKVKVSVTPFHESDSVAAHQFLQSHRKPSGEQIL